MSARAAKADVSTGSAVTTTETKIVMWDWVDGVLTIDGAAAETRLKTAALGTNLKYQQGLLNETN